MAQRQDKIKHKKGSSIHNIRIRQGSRSNNVSPQSRQKQQKQEEYKKILENEPSQPSSLSIQPMSVVIGMKPPLSPVPIPIPAPISVPISHISNKTASQSGNETSLQFGSLLKHIPRTVQMQDNILVQGCFSYVDEGFEKWKVGKIIGKGNSCVRKAINVKTGVIAAVKQIIFNQDQEKQKLDEIKILKKFQHPNIVMYLQHYKIKQQTWIFMEYVSTNLRNFYLQFGPPPTKILLHFSKQIVCALAYLQKKNVIHQDIKCQNILLDNQGTLKLCDFGCSKDFRSTMSLKLYEQNQNAKTFKGSYLWAAPQHLLSKGCLASDIWSLGCTMLQLATAKLPWSQKNFDNYLQAINFIVSKNQTPHIPEQLDQKVKQIIESCLKRDPAQRITAVQLNERKDLWQ